MLRTASGLPSGGLVQALMKTSSAAQMISEKVNRPPSGPTAQKPQGSSSPLFPSPSPQHRFGRCRPRPPQREPEVPPPPAPSVCRALRTRQQSTINIISGSGGTHWKVLAPGHFSACTALGLSPRHPLSLLCLLRATGQPTPPWPFRCRW